MTAFIFIHYGHEWCYVSGGEPLCIQLTVKDIHVVSERDLLHSKFSDYNQVSELKLKCWLAAHTCMNVFVI